MNKVRKELDFIYYYEGKKFLTLGEALKYKNYLEFIKNEQELIEESKERLETPLGVGFAQKDYK